jgi:hypothetical protein
MHDNGGGVVLLLDYATYYERLWYRVPVTTLMRRILHVTSTVRLGRIDLQTDC